MSTASIEFQTLLAYNHADAERWHAYFVQHPEALEIEVGGKMSKVRNLIAHIFEVEFFFASELDAPGANYTQLNPDSLDEMYAKHEEAHGLLARYLETAAEEEMRKMHIFKRGDKEYQHSSRKLLAQIVWHSVNHWGQIAMLVRRAGLETGPPHDIIASTVVQ